MICSTCAAHVLMPERSWKPAVVGRRRFQVEAVKGDPPPTEEEARKHLRESGRLERLGIPPAPMLIALPPVVFFEFRKGAPEA